MQPADCVYITAAWCTPAKC